MKVLRLLSRLLCLVSVLRVPAEAVEIVLASGQVPRQGAGIARVAVVDGGLWDGAGRVLMSGRYRPSPPSVVERNAVWASSGPASATELYSDGDSVPYTSAPVIGPVIPISVPIIQPTLGGYRPPAGYRAFQSAVVTSLPLIPESRALWVDWAGRETSGTVFVVNDLEDHVDGVVRFTRPTLHDAIIQITGGGVSVPVAEQLPQDGVQYYVNGSFSANAAGRGGSVVWRVRTPFQPVISEQRNGVVQMIAASSSMGLPSLPGGRWDFIRVMGVLPGGHPLWQAADIRGTTVLRGDPSGWSPLFEPGMPGPDARGVPPSPASPVARIGAVSMAAGGSAVVAEATYASSAGPLSGRSALLMHEGSAPRLMAFSQEWVDGTVPGTRLEAVSLGSFDAPTSSLMAFHNPVRGGTQPSASQAVLLASDSGLWMLARQFDPLPVPAGVTRVLQFRFPVLSAKPDGTVAFAAEVQLASGQRREILYEVTPGIPNTYRVLLSSGDTLSVPTPEGPRTSVITRFNRASWRPGTFDRLLVGVELDGGSNSAVVLIGEGPASSVALDAVLEGAGEFLRLRWPASSAAVIEAAPSLQSDVWSRLPVEPVVVEGFKEVRLPVDPVGARFFRLR